MNSNWTLFLVGMVVCGLSGPGENGQAATKASAPSTEPKDPLWRKAVAVAATNADWVPGLVITRSEVLRKGESQGTHEIWQRSKPGPKGEVLTETFKVLEDGKDVTKEEVPEKKEKPPGKEKKAAKKTEDKGGGGNPFDPEYQDQLYLSVTNRSRTIEGRECIGYLFELRNTNGPVVRGTAWVEKGSGVPVEIENMTVDPLPDKHLKYLTMTTHYGNTTNGAWLAKSTETTSTVSVLFIKADIRSTITFSEHWKRTP